MSEWEAAQSTGEYRAPLLEAQGCIHASTENQVLETAARFYKGGYGLVLLTIDLSRLRAEVRYEPPAMHGHSKGSDLFPHIYGAVNLDAVVVVSDFPADEDGRFSMPSQASTSLDAGA